MIRILLLFGFIFYSLPSLAKIVYAKASFMHGEEISTKDGCKFAREKAELEAIQKGIGVTISSENLKKCFSRGIGRFEESDSILGLKKLSKAHKWILKIFRISDS